MKGIPKVAPVVVVTTKDKQPVLREVSATRDEPLHIIRLVPMRDIGTGGLGKPVNRGLLRHPLLGEQVDTVVCNEEGLAIEIIVFGLIRKVGLILVRIPNRVHFERLVQDGLLFDSEDMEVVAVPVIVSGNTDIDVQAVLRELLTVAIDTPFKADGIQDSPVCTVNHVETAVEPIVVSPIVVFPVKQGGGIEQQGVQFRDLDRRDDGGVVEATAVIDGGIGIVIDGQRIRAAAYLGTAPTRGQHQQDCEKDMGTHILKFTF